MNKRRFEENNKCTVYKAGIEEFLPVMQAVIGAGGRFTFCPFGNSMKPFIRPGKDSVNVVRADTPVKYDIVLYRRDNGQFVLHRIIEVNDEGYVMCGDNQWTREYGITGDMIIAKVSDIIRDGRVVLCSSKKYMLWVHIWCDLFWIRKLYLKLRSIAKRVLKGE